MTPSTCPVCGTPVRVVGSAEGTQHYEPLASSPAELQELATLIAKDWSGRKYDPCVDTHEPGALHYHPTATAAADRPGRG